MLCCEAICRLRPYLPLTCGGVNRESVITVIPSLQLGVISCHSPLLPVSGYDAVTGQNTTDSYSQLGCSYFPYTSTLIPLLGLGVPPGSDAALGVLILSPY